MKNCIIAHGGLADWLMILKKLSLDISLNVKFIIGSDQGKFNAYKYFPKVYYYKNSAKKKQCFIPKQFQFSLTKDKNKEFFRRLDIYKNNYLKMLDRFNYDGSFSQEKRQRFYVNHALF